MFWGRRNDLRSPDWLRSVCGTWSGIIIFMGEIRELHYNDQTHPNELLGVWALKYDGGGRVKSTNISCGELSPTEALRLHISDPINKNTIYFNCQLAPGSGQVVSKWSRRCCLAKCRVWVWKLWEQQWSRNTAWKTHPPTQLAFLWKVSWGQKGLKT